MKHNQIYFREFSNGYYVIGVLEYKGGRWWLDCDYFVNLDLSEWTLIGEL